MKVRLTTTISGTRDGADWPAKGEVVDLPDDEAAELCAAGGAVPEVDDKVETATAKRKPETRKK